jgi:hypothetical protein
MPVYGRQEATSFFQDFVRLSLSPPHLEEKLLFLLEILQHFARRFPVLQEPKIATELLSLSVQLVRAVPIAVLHFIEVWYFLIQKREGTTQPANLLEYCSVVTATLERFCMEFPNCLARFLDCGIGVERALINTREKHINPEYLSFYPSFIMFAAFAIPTQVNPLRWVGDTLFTAGFNQKIYYIIPCAIVSVSRVFRQLRKLKCIRVAPPFGERLSARITFAEQTSGKDPIDDCLESVADLEIVSNPRAAKGFWDRSIKFLDEFKQFQTMPKYVAGLVKQFARQVTAQNGSPTLTAYFRVMLDLFLNLMIKYYYRLSLVRDYVLHWPIVIFHEDQTVTEGRAFDRFNLFARISFSSRDLTAAFFGHMTTSIIQVLMRYLRKGHLSLLGVQALVCFIGENSDLMNMVLARMMKVALELLAKFHTAKYRDTKLAQQWIFLMIKLAGQSHNSRSFRYLTNLFQGSAKVFFHTLCVALRSQPCQKVCLELVAWMFRIIRLGSGDADLMKFGQRLPPGHIEEIIPSAHAYAAALLLPLVAPDVDPSMYQPLLFHGLKSSDPNLVAKSVDLVLKLFRQSKFEDFQSAADIDTYIPTLNAYFNVLRGPSSKLALTVLESIPSHMAIFTRHVKKTQTTFEKPEPVIPGHGVTLYQVVTALEQKMENEANESPYLFSILSALFDPEYFAKIKTRTLKKYISMLAHLWIHENLRGLISSLFSRLWSFFAELRDHRCFLSLVPASTSGRGPISRMLIEEARHFLRICPVEVFRQTADALCNRIQFNHGLTTLVLGCSLLATKDPSLVQLHHIKLIFRVITKESIVPIPKLLNKLLKQVLPAMSHSDKQSFVEFAFSLGSAADLFCRFRVLTLKALARLKIRLNLDAIPQGDDPDQLIYFVSACCLCGITGGLTINSELLDKIKSTLPAQPQLNREAGFRVILLGYSALRCRITAIIDMPGFISQLMNFCLLAFQGQDAFFKLAKTCFRILISDYQSRPEVPKFIEQIVSMPDKTRLLERSVVAL